MSWLENRILGVDFKRNFQTKRYDSASIRQNIITPLVKYHPDKG